MKNELALKLATYLASHGINQNDLSKKMKRSPATVTSILQGQRCKPDALKALLESIPNPAERREIIIAHFKDESDKMGVRFEDVIEQLTDRNNSLYKFLTENEKWLDEMSALCYGRVRDPDLDSLLTYLANMILKRNEDDWTIDNDEKIIIKAVAKLEPLSPSIAYKSLENSCRALLHDLISLVNRKGISGESLDRALKVIWDDEDFLKIAKLALTYNDEPIMMVASPDGAEYNAERKEK